MGSQDQFKRPLGKCTVAGIEDEVFLMMEFVEGGEVIVLSEDGAFSHRGLSSITVLSPLPGNDLTAKEAKKRVQKVKEWSDTKK